MLSGGAPRIGHESLKLGNCGEYLDKADFPILGLCIGHQFIALHHGGTAGPADTPEFGKVELILDEPDDILKGLPERSIIWMSHNDEVKSLPDDFIVLGHSQYCEVQAIKYLKKPFYGLQFHPEVNDTQYGKEIFQNFVDICKK